MTWESVLVGKVVVVCAFWRACVRFTGSSGAFLLILEDFDAIFA